MHRDCEAELRENERRVVGCLNVGVNGRPRENDCETEHRGNDCEGGLKSTLPAALLQRTSGQKLTR